MKPTKSERQARILQMIRDLEIGTQEDLVAGLNNAGLDVTQATISRDIKELGIIKVTTATGIQKYISLERTGEVASGRLMKIFAEAVLNVEVAMNLVIIKTMPGMAQASASALDSMRLSEVVGTIAGDDTVFVAARSIPEALSLAEALNQLVTSGGAAAARRLE